MSDKNMDDLLAQLKAEFEPERSRSLDGVQLPKSQKNQSSTSSQLNQSNSSPPKNPAPKVSMAHMLDGLRQELESGRGRAISPPEQSATSTQPQLSAKEAAEARRQLNALIDQDYQEQAQKREAQLLEIQRQAEIKLLEEKRRQQELIELQQREELRARRRQEALREEAKTWLAKLDSRSEEGKWFQEFSYSYENKLQAAIDYLEAMQETGL